MGFLVVINTLQISGRFTAVCLLEDDHLCTSRDWNFLCSTTKSTVWCCHHDIYCVYNNLGILRTITAKMYQKKCCTPYHLKIGAKRLENRRMWTGARDETNQKRDVKQPRPTRSHQTKTWTERCRLVGWIQVSVVTRSGTADTSGNRTRKQTNHSILLTLLVRGTERHIQQEETQDLKLHLTFFFPNSGSNGCV